MTHPPRHSRPNARQQHDQYAVGPSLLDEVGSRPPRRTRKAQDEQRVEHAQQQQQHHAETDAEHAQQQQQQHAETDAPAWQEGARASLTAPNNGAQQMARLLAARATCCGRTSDVLHQAYGTDSALGGALPGDAATCRDASSHMRAWLQPEHVETVDQALVSACTDAEPPPPPTPPYTTHQKAADLQSEILNIDDEVSLLQIIQTMQVATTIAVQQLCQIHRQHRGAVFREAARPFAKTRNQSTPGCSSASAPGWPTSEVPIPAGVNFRNINAAAAASANELHDGEGYPSASKTFAEPQVELEQQSALGPTCDVALLASLMMDLDVAALA